MNVVFGQFGFQQIVSTPTEYSSNIKSADFDADGDMDVVQSSRDGSMLSWFENDGTGYFLVRHTISLEGNGFVGLDIADIDSDGDSDVISSIPYEDKILWYVNDGFGNFEEEIVITLDAEVSNDLHCDDLDGDGDIDVIFYVRGYDDIDEIAWSENDGTGNFEDKVIISTDVDSPSSVYSGDLDSDGDIDIVSASFTDDKVAWYENDGTGVFGPSIEISDDVNGASGARCADMDDDGDLDVISLSNYGELAWFENDGIGGFGPQVIISEDILNARYLHIADLDDDGYNDVLTSSTASDEILWFKNDGIGGFSLQPLIGLVEGAWGLSSSDLDGDGDLEVLSSSRVVDEIAWFHNEGAGVFGDEILINPIADGVESVSATDLDGDGDIDVLSASYYDDKIAWYKNLGDELFSAQIIISNDVDQPKKVFTADLDNDGDEDVISVSKADNKIAWYENDGEGNFGDQIIISDVALLALDAFAADIDADGDLDILSATVGDDKVSWYENDGSGIFGPPNVITETPLEVRSVYAEDLDGDGDVDVLSSSYTEDKVEWYENDGAGVFGPAIIITTMADEGTQVIAVDIDNDGDNDAVSCSRGDDKIAWYQNDGEGNFGPQLIISLELDYPISISSADIDGDGDIDIIATGSGQVAWFENEGAGEFSAKLVLPAESDYPSSIFPIDIDQDGDDDVLSSDFNNDEIIWNENYFISGTQIKGTFFYDANENGVYDSLEIGIPSNAVLSSPESDYTYTYEDGNYFMNFAPDFGTYLISPGEIPYWALITDSLNYTVAVDDDFVVMDSLDFGFFPDTMITEIATTITGAFPRCNQIINYWLNYQNTGTNLTSGIIKLTLDDDVEYTSASISPDSIIDQNIYWHYDSLMFFSDEQIVAQVQMPSFELMGETLSSSFDILETDDLGDTIYSNTDTLHQILACAYDPNDKVVTPAGMDSLGYIPPSIETLDYTIRFQNTGTDTAFTIVIKDELDSNLNWFSLIPIASSHDMHVEVEDNGEVIFTFDNIMLPDSNVNELASHGFVRYKIDINDDVALGTEINNTANIYFDLNPAIVTNTTINTVDCIDTAIITLGDEADNFLCINSGPVDIISDKLGGEFYGTGVVVDEFDPVLAGIGSHLIFYDRDTDNGCFYSNSIEVEVGELPDVSIIPLETDTICNIGLDIPLFGSPGGGVFIGSGVVDGYFVPDLADLGLNTVYYYFEDEYDCGSTDSTTIYLTDCLGIDEVNNNSIVVYPNPFSLSTTLYFDNNFQSPYTIIINNSLGIEVLRIENIFNDRVEIMKEDLGTGIFILSVIDSNSEILLTKKLIVN